MQLEGEEELDSLASATRYVARIGTSLTFRVHYLESCTSTQDVAASLAEAGAPEGTLVLAEEQTAGRGRMGRNWASPRGGLWLTLVLRPGEASLLGPLSLSAGVAVARALGEVCGVDARLKWPNDVLVSGRKVAGVLVEGSAEARALRYALVGIGINVNNDLPPELRATAVSLREVVGRRVPRVPLLLSLLKHLDRLYSHLRLGGAQPVLKEWARLSSTIGARVRVITRDGAVEGVAVGLDERGGLVVEVGGSRLVFYAGEVVHLR